MKFYKTKENNIINLDQVTCIYRDPEDGTYRIAFTSGLTYEMPEITEKDIDRLMDYNDYLID